MPNRRSDAFALPERTAVGEYAGDGEPSYRLHGSGVAGGSDPHFGPKLFDTLYESFGFEVVSDEYLEAGIPHKKMLIRLDREHGRSVKPAVKKPSHLLFASLVTTKRLRACATGNNTTFYFLTRY